MVFKILFYMYVCEGHMVCLWQSEDWKDEYVHSVGPQDLNSDCQACWQVLLHAKSSGLGVWLLGTCSFGFRRDSPHSSERTRVDQLLTLPAHSFSSAGTRPYSPLPCIFLRLAQSSPCWLLGAFIFGLLCSTRPEDWLPDFQCTNLCCCHLPTSLVSAL